MSLAYPSFLYFLPLISIPILLHLWSIKRAKQEYFSNVSLLRKLSIISNKTSRLKHLLLLFTRICFVLFLTLAFAKLYDSKLPTRINNSIDLNLDKSCSVIASMKDKGKLEKILSLTSEKKESPDKYNLPNASFECTINAPSMGDYLGKKGNAESAIISDYQLNFVDLDKIKKRSTPLYLVHLNPVETNPNVSVDSVWLTNAYIKKGGSANEISVRLHNTGGAVADHITVELKVENTTIASQLVKIEAKSKLTVRFQVVNDVKKRILCQLRVDDGSWSFDNVFDFVLTPPEKLPILLITDKIKKHPIKIAYDQEETFKCQLVDDEKGNTDYLRHSDLFVVDKQSEPNKTLLHSMFEEVGKGKTMVLFTSEQWAKPTFDFINKELGSIAVAKLPIPNRPWKRR